MGEITPNHHPRCAGIPGSLDTEETEIWVKFGSSEGGVHRIPGFWGILSIGFGCLIALGILSQIGENQKFWGSDRLSLGFFNALGIQSQPMT